MDKSKIEESKKREIREWREKKTDTPFKVYIIYFETLDFFDNAFLDLDTDFFIQSLYLGLYELFWCFPLHFSST